jgi:hypothetical protein
MVSPKKRSQLGPMQRHRQQHRERAVWNEALLKLRQHHQSQQQQHQQQQRPNGDEPSDHAAVVALPVGELSAILSSVHRNVSYPNRGISAQECGVMVSLLCQIILPLPANAHEALACELSEYITSLAHKRSLELDYSQLHIILSFFLATIPRCSSFFLTDHLKALSFILFENGDRCSELLDQLVRTCLVNERITGPTAMNLDAKQQALTCIGNLLAKAPTPDTRPFLAAMFDCALHAFTQYADSAPDGHAALDTSKVLSASLRVVRAVASISGPGDHPVAGIGGAGASDGGSAPTVNLAKHVPTLVHRLCGLFTYGLDLSSTQPSASTSTTSRASPASATTPVRARVQPPGIPPVSAGDTRQPFEQSHQDTPQTSARPPTTATTPDKPTNPAKPMATSASGRPWRSSRARRSDVPGNRNRTLAQLSESEFSDACGTGYSSAPRGRLQFPPSDAGSHESMRHSQCMPGSSRLRNNFAKVRAGSLDLVHVLARVAPKVMHSYWTLLLPQRDCTSRVPARPHLLTAMLYDPLPNIRASACMAVAALLEHGSLPKWLATLASSSSSPSTGARGCHADVSVEVAEAAAAVSCPVVSYRRVSV